MTHLDLGHRDRTVERMLLRGGFNRDTIIAVKPIIESRAATQRPAPAQTSAMASSTSGAA